MLKEMSLTDVRVLSETRNVPAVVPRSIAKFPHESPHKTCSKFHQHFMGSFYLVPRSPKSKKMSNNLFVFLLLGSVHIEKAAN